MKYLLAVLLLLGSSAAIAANPPLYDVEIVVFAHVNEAAATAEVWSAKPAVPDAGRTVSLAALRAAGARGTPDGFTLLPDHALRLTKHAAQLKRSGRHEVLLHIGWRQPGLDRKQALALTIDELLGNNAGRSPADPSWPASAGPRLSGFVVVQLSRFLHLGADLVYEKGQAAPARPAAFPVEPARPALAFQLQESRRMRSRELHYFDHPAFGIVALITPYEAAAR